MTDGGTDKIPSVGLCHLPSLVDRPQDRRSWRGSLSSTPLCARDSKPRSPLKPSVHIFRACLHFSGSAPSSCGPQLASVAPLSWALPPSRNPFVFPRSSLFAHVVTTNPTLSPPPNTTPHTTSQLRATACALHQFIVHRQHANQVPSQVPRTAKHSHAQPQPQPVPTANGHSHTK